MREQRIYGEMSEWFMELVLKTSDRATGRGFESLSLRQNSRKVRNIRTFRLFDQKHINISQKGGAAFAKKSAFLLYPQQPFQSRVLSQLLF